jgi:hypothetical protein
MNAFEAVASSSFEYAGPNLDCSNEEASTALLPVPSWGGDFLNGLLLVATMKNAFEGVSHIYI